MRGAIALLVFASMSQYATVRAEAPRIGDTNPELRFKDIRALPRTLSDFGKKRAYVFVFTTTSCPLVRRSIPKLTELDARYTSQHVQFVAVNVGANDTIRDMAAQAIELDAAFAFVKDADLSCAKALGVTRTPGVAVLDGDRKLIYRGRIDDQLRLGGTRPEPTRRDLEEAIRETLEAKPVSVPETTVDGCMIEAPLPPSVKRLDPTYHQDIAPILRKRCVSCHVEGTAAPFALLTYRDAASHAEMIGEVVADQRMPPWFANPKHGTFQNDPSLTISERETIASWVRSGRAEGDAPSEVEPIRTSAPRWRIGEPDLIITMFEEHSVPATGFVPYRNVLLPHVFLADTWVEAFEIRPENPSVVHHCNMAFITTKGAGEHTFITGHVPGGLPMDLGRFNNGTAFFIPKFAALGLQIHYTTTGKEETCRIQVGMRFPRRTVQKQIRHIMLDPHRIAIPPGHGAYAMQATKTLDRDISLLGMFTHMHVRGKDMTFFATAPDKPRETLLQIPNYNFEWQLGYELEPGRKRLPKGTVIEAIAHYDNSAFNPYNPDPKRTVPWGEQTYDEMFNGFVFFVDDNEQLNLAVNPKNGQVKK